MSHGRRIGGAGMRRSGLPWDSQIVSTPPATGTLDAALALAMWSWWFDAEHRSGTTLINRAGGANATISSLDDIVPATLGGRAALERLVSYTGTADAGSVQQPTGVRIFTVFESSETAESELLAWYGGAGDYWLENVSGTYPQLRAGALGVSSSKTYAQLGDGAPHVVCVSYLATHASHTLHLDGTSVGLSTFGGESGDPSFAEVQPLSLRGSDGYGPAMKWGMSAACAHGALDAAGVVAVSELLMSHYGVP